MDAREKEELLTAATLALFQRVKNSTAIHTLLMQARSIAESMDYDEEYRKLIRAIDAATCLIPVEAERFAQSVLEVDPDEWDHFTGLDFDRLVDIERQSRGEEPFNFDSYDTIPYEHPADIIRRLKGLG